MRKILLFCACNYRFLYVHETIQPVEAQSSSITKVKDIVIYENNHFIQRLSIRYYSA